MTGCAVNIVRSQPSQAVQDVKHEVYSRDFQGCIPFTNIITKYTFLCDRRINDGSVLKHPALYKRTIYHLAQRFVNLILPDKKVF